MGSTWSRVAVHLDGAAWSELQRTARALRGTGRSQGGTEALVEADGSAAPNERREQGTAPQQMDPEAEADVEATAAAAAAASSNYEHTQ